MSDAMAHAGPLRALAPGHVTPEQLSTRAQLITWLHAIDHVHVHEAVKRPDGKRFLVDVYMKRTQNRIPTVGSGIVASRQATLRVDHAPDFTAEHRFAEFSRLLTDLYSLAEESHGLHQLRCPFCEPILEYVLRGQRAPSGLSRWLKSDASVCEQFTNYTNNVLELVRCVPRHEDHADCLGAQRAPLVMRQFLRPGDGDNDGVAVSHGGKLPRGF